MSEFAFTDDMREISGFGGEYEAACRKMVLAGVEWLRNNPQETPEIKEIPGVFGLTKPGNLAGQKLEDAIDAAVPDCSGAMSHAALLHVLFIRKNGWPAYVESMSRKE